MSEDEDVKDPGPRKLQVVGELNNQKLAPCSKLTDKEELEYLLPFFDVPLRQGTLVCENGQWKRIHKKKTISFQSNNFEYNQVTSCNEFLIEIYKPLCWVHKDENLLSTQLSSIFVTNSKEERDTTHKKETSTKPYKLIDSFPDPDGEIKFQMEIPYIYRTRIVKIYKRVDESEHINKDEVRDLPISLKHSDFLHDQNVHESYQMVNLFIVFDNREVNLNKRHRIKSSKFPHQKEVIRVIDNSATHKSVIYEKTFIDVSRAYDFESGREYLGQEQAREMSHLLLSSTPTPVGKPGTLELYSREYKQNAVMVEEYERPQLGELFPAFKYKSEGEKLLLDVRLNHYGFRDDRENCKVYQIVSGSFLYGGRVYPTDRIELVQHPFNYQREALVGDNGRSGWYDNRSLHVSTKYEKIFINTENAIDFIQREYVVDQRRLYTDLHVNRGSERYWGFWSKIRYRIPHSGEEYLHDD